MAFALLLAIVVLNGGSGLFFANRVGVSVATLTDVALPSLNAIHALHNDMQQMHGDLLIALNRLDSSRGEKTVAALSDFYEISRAMAAIPVAAQLAAMPFRLWANFCAPLRSPLLSACWILCSSVTDSCGTFSSI